MIRPFQFAKAPELHFGEGKISVLPALIKRYGSKVLLVTGARSFVSSGHGQALLEKLRAEKVQVTQYAVTREPSPEVVDDAVKNSLASAPDVVVAIGGGSALDGGKAISAMLPLGEGVKAYLEGVGNTIHPGSKTPFIAVPTTSGTGSEATKNAVISSVGETGFKRSLRHDNFMPDAAIVDPVLTLECPPGTTAASGMDAFTQLLESYVSTAANPMTDALALEGLHRVSRSLLRAYRDGADLDARTDMAFAAYLSGITLANAGLGLVHGFSSPVGGFFDIPHGIVCSALMAPSNKITVRKLRSENSNHGALKKYATVGRLFLGQDNQSDDYCTDFLIDLIGFWKNEMDIPSLSQYGIKQEHLQKIADKTDAKNNPSPITKEDMLEVLESAL